MTWRRHRDKEASKGVEVKSVPKFQPKTITISLGLLEGTTCRKTDDETTDRVEHGRTGRTFFP